MERLTINEVIGGLKGIVCSEWNGEMTYGARVCDDAAHYLERAAELANAERDGRLVMLPCKVGDKIYDPIPGEEDVGGDCFISGIVLTRSTLVDGVFDDIVPLEDIGRIIFLTRAEAEAALREKP